MEPSPSYSAANARTVWYALRGVSERRNRRAYFGHPRTIGCDRYRIATSGRDHHRVCHGGNSTRTAAAVTIARLARIVSAGNGHNAGQTVASITAPAVTTACHSRRV